MKKRYLLFSFMLIATQFLGAQVRNCQSHEYLMEQLEHQPERSIQLDRIEQFTKSFVEDSLAKSNVDGIITIPVVIHVVYANANQNISEAQIQSQLDVLNADFRRLNSDANNTWSQAADSQIEFCLATVDPDGNPTSGITRTSTNSNPFSDDDRMKSSGQGGTDVWDAASYLNVWVCEMAGGILGYAQFPGGPASTDGVVCDYRYFGTTGTATAPFDLGRTMTHEVGHYLNLYHIWGDGGCNVDDLVGDTPNSDGPNFGCDTGHSSCSTPDMIENYMDYSDDGCMNLYTSGQKDRMRALFAAGGARASLLSSTACGGGGGGGTTCAVPTGLSTGNTTASTTNVSWNSSAGAQSYQLQYRLVGAANWTTQANISGTSFALTGLDNCSDYQVRLRTNCGEENSSYGSVINFSTTGCPLGCQDNEITLTIVPDNYGSEITWEVKDGDNVLFSGGPYTNDDNTPVIVDLCLDNGCYDFVISDAYGDGICCNWGNGSYTLTDALGNELASGGEYSSNETKNFCLGGGEEPTGDAGVVRIIRPVADNCGGSIEPRVRIKNFGTTPLTAVQINYDVDGGTSQTFAWTGSLTPGSAVNVNLPVISTSTGAHTFTATTAQPNGGADANPANDGESKSFNTTAGEQVRIQVKPDDFGSEITWLLEDDNGNVVAEGGPYNDNDNTVKTKSICLEDGCYTFTINDAFGDGICCNWGTGWYRIKNTANQNIISGNGQYGSFESQSFCIGGNQRGGFLTTDEQKVPSVSVYPNPSQGEITVKVNNARVGTIMKVYNTMGRLVKAVAVDSENETRRLDFTDLPAGVYIIKLGDGKKSVTQKVMIF